MLPRIKHLFHIYQKNIYSIFSNVSVLEYDYITESLGNITEDDICNDEHLSCYSFVISIEDGEINPSRFIVGTKTNSDLFEKNALNMLNNLNICPKTPNEFKWYGVGWDIKNDQIKIYFLKNDLSQIHCKEYSRSSSEKIREKIYDVGEKCTKMHKDYETIDQVNSNIYDHEVVDKMVGLGFNLDTYSQHKDKVTLYFD
mgnify:FL=1|tara:strand:+ start:5563 stop:6159 length:597 start_codon:yes stop_codon:yes gene_type:complete